jgi:opacity protein-like surface antigen
MKKRFLTAILAVSLLTLASASAAVANPNKAPIEANCEGQPVTVLVNFKANGQSSVAVAGGGSFTTTELRIFLHESGEELFSETTHFPLQPTVTCTGTFFFPEVGALVDFTVSGVLHGSS